MISDDMDLKERYTRNVFDPYTKYQLMVDFYDGPLELNGDMKTWPYFITRSICCAKAETKHSYLPEKAVNMLFI